MEFKWNPNKAELNFDKHGVSFQEAATIFNDPLSISFPSFPHPDHSIWEFPHPDHSIGESRYVIIGISRFGKILVVAHTD
jgi:uncharacterized DUF497 family protein